MCFWFPKTPCPPYALNRAGPEHAALWLRENARLMQAANPRGGRPRIANPKTLRVNVRLASDEHCEIGRKATAAGVSMSEYMRIAALGMTPDRRHPPRPGREAPPLIDSGLFHELRRQGVNLHQIVKHLNIHQTPIAAFEQDVRELLARIRGIINRIPVP